ncbi:hypothetical protein Taro_017577, partial [Colocasia esculenta]|nr:hypothetical protein [Colocasia esculenta]
TQPSWHRCQDTAMKVSPSVTERREVTCHVLHQKILRAKPALGHTLTRQPGPQKHPRQHGYFRDLQGRCDTITMGKGTVTATLSRRGKRITTAILIATGKRVAIRSRPTRQMPLLVSRFTPQSRHQQRGRPTGCSIPRPPTSHTHHHTGEGSMEKQ